MTLTFVLLALLSAAVLASSSTQPHPSQMRVTGIHTFYAVASQIISGAVYSNKTARSHVTCAIFCLQDDFCKSFQFCTGRKLCSLNSAAHSTDAFPLKPSDGCFYFDDTIQEAGSSAPCATYKEEPGATTTIYNNNFPERIHLSVLTTEIVRVTAHKQGGYQYVEFQPPPRESRVYATDDYYNRTKIHAGIKLDGSRYWIAFNYSKISVGKYGIEDPLMVYTDPNAGSYRKFTVWNQLKTVWQLYEKC